MIRQQCNFYYDFALCTAGIGLVKAALFDYNTGKKPVRNQTVNSGKLRNAVNPAQSFYLLDPLGRAVKIHVCTISRRVLN